MVKLTALYKQPEDQKSFDEHYYQTHLPLAGKMPGLVKVEVTRYSATPMGDKSPYYLQADLYFEDKKALDDAMKSPEGKAAAKDVMSFAGKLVTMIIGEVQGETK
ncbi:EthD family reductase [Thermoactinomyces mirandus]|uniref:EthD family reductase n=1 Tax=Thermoactinomyces mirandus TaxID=2756294 RepID=A0A7W1XRE3_9BACL|nr:EthD family reductase [Thermoactinomyces mirandus]MBA4601899.1 EthD family reductase [Thermoactinomyces mirandus]